MIIFVNQQYSLEKIEPSISPGRFDLPEHDRRPDLSYPNMGSFYLYCLHAILSFLETKR